MSQKTDILAAYFDTVQDRSKEAEAVEAGALVENANGARFTVEKVSTNYEDVKKYDKRGEGAAWLAHNGHITEAQTWMVVKDAQGKHSITRYGDDGVRVIEEKSFDSKPEHVRVDNSIMSAYQETIIEANEAKIQALKEELEEREYKGNIHLTKYSIEKPNSKRKKFPEMWLLKWEGPGQTRIDAFKSEEDLKGHVSILKQKQRAGNYE